MFKINTLEQGTVLQESIFKNTSVILLLINSKQQVCGINKIGLKLLNKRKIDVLNKACGEVLNCINATEGIDMACSKKGNCMECIIRNNVKKTLLTGNEIHKKEAHLDIFDDGRKTRLNLLISTSKIISDDGEFVLLTIDEITNIFEKERQLSKINEELLNKSQKIEEYAFYNSHKTRAPLARILGLLSIIDTHKLDDDSAFIFEKLKDCSAELDDAIKEMTNILYDAGFLRNLQIHNNQSFKE